MPTISIAVVPTAAAAAAKAHVHCLPCARRAYRVAAASEQRLALALAAEPVEAAAGLEPA